MTASGSPDLDMTCPLCLDTGGALIASNDLLRVVLVDEPDYPGFCRVILNAHRREMTDLAPADIARVMAAVLAVEDALRAVMAPTKINLASLGNQVSHVHWHVIPRHADDAHFPQPVWGQRQREPAPASLQARRALLPALIAEIRSRLPSPSAQG